MNKKKILVTSIVFSGILTFVSFFVGGVKYPDSITGIMPIWAQLMRNFGIFLVLITPTYALYHKFDMNHRRAKNGTNKKFAFLRNVIGETLTSVIFIGYAAFMIWGLWFLFIKQ